MAINTRDAVIAVLREGLTKGSIALRDPKNESAFIGADAIPHAEVMIHENEAYDDFLLGSLGIGEGYMRGDWTSSDVPTFIGILLINRNRLLKLVIKQLRRVRLRYAVKIGAWYARHFFAHVFDRYKTSAQRQYSAKNNVRRHYDLNVDFFRRMLDPTMTYSCGRMKEGTSDSLEDMQREKYDNICKKLALATGHRLIDIGCGFGGMLEHAAKWYGITGLGITLSEDQYAYAKKRLKGLPVEVKLLDYRNLQNDGAFDAFVSIGMFEHVGSRRRYRQYFDIVSRNLRPGGRGLLHAIGSVSRGSGSDPWIQKYIFPGGRLPRLHEIQSAIRQAGLKEDEDIGIDELHEHYVVTLRRWNENFQSNWPAIRRLDPTFDETFKRMWEYYLQASEAGFRYGDLRLYQVPFRKAS